MTTPTKARSADAMLEELESLAGRMAVKVSYEALQTVVGGGGLCRVKGAYRVIIDKRSSAGERVATLAHALGQVGFDGVELRELSPAARELLGHAALRRAS